MAKRQQRSQLMELYFHVAELLGHTADRDLARLADVGMDNVANWRNGAVKEFKVQTLNAVKTNLTARFTNLREQLRWRESGVELGLIPLEVEESSGPAALQRQFADRMNYDYLGHRFLYFEAQGALAWENLISTGYQQECWLKGVHTCLQTWLDTGKDHAGHCRGVLARALGFGRRGTMKGLDVVSLGPGEGGKEVVILEQILATQERAHHLLSWLTLALVDVSIPLLLTATKAAKSVAGAAGDHANHFVLPVCADFEEGSLTFTKRLPTAGRDDDAGARLVPILGNVFGNVRDEERFIQQNLGQLVRPGDFVWLEVGVRPENIEDEPLFAMTTGEGANTAAFSSRRLLLEGPYRRWEAALGRRPTEIETRVWMREDDDSCRIPGSLNFCHDLLFKDERRVCTMLYSRRYQVAGLSRWLEGHSYSVLEVVPTATSGGRQGVVHLLLQRT